MNRPSSEQLLGYLLQALSPPELEQVESELQSNADLRAELEQLESCLNHVGLRGEPELFAPPPGLAERTCQFVAAQAPVGVVPRERMTAPAIERERRYSWSDLITMAAVFVAALSFFLPAVSFSRFQSQIASCQNQLRLIGFGMHGFSELQPDHSFPGPEADGPRAAAGVVAPTLVSHQLANPRSFLCPSSSTRKEAFQVPSLEVLDQATRADLLAMHRTMGGDFGFNMGFVQNGRLQRPRDARRSGYVLVGDAPSNSRPHRTSSNHQGRGQNILYEDGHIHFLPQLPNSQLLDDPYHNREGWIAAGVDSNDAVLGASSDHPLPVRLADEVR